MEGREGGRVGRREQQCVSLVLRIVGSARGCEAIVGRERE